MPEQTHRKVPVVRFKGFDAEWNTLKLGDLGKVATNKRIFMHETSSTGDVPFYKIGSFGREPKLFISQELFESYKQRFPFPEKGDLLFSVIGSIGRVVEYQGKDEYFQDSNVVWLQHNGAIVNSFLKQFYSFVKWSGLEGSTIKHLYNRNILSTPIDLPCQEEQTRIGEYFKSLDRLIELYQRKHDKLVTLKQAMLRKMFPQDGATTPEIRFKGFEGEWEETIVGEICSISTGKSNTQDRIEDGLYSFYVRSQTVERSNRYLYDEEAVLTVGDGVGTGKVFHYVNGKYDLHQRVYRMFNFLEDTRARFFFYFFSKEFYDRVMAMTAKTSVDSVRMEMIYEMPFLRPSPAEQTKIGAYFYTLDELISKHATQLEKLKNIKSACIEKMFV